MLPPRFAFARALAAVLPLYGLAAAQEEHVATARKLANDGINAIVEGDCDTGLPLVQRAEEIHHAVVHQRYIAHCLTGSGRLVAATEVWRQMIREGAPAEAPAVVHDAIAHARSRLEETLPRLANTTIALAKSYENLQLELDGQPMSSALIDAPQVIDPGKHVLRASAAGHESAAFRWEVEPGEKASVLVTLRELPRRGLPPRDVPVEPARDEGIGSVTLLGIVIGTTGLAAIAAGTTAWVVKEDKEKAFSATCDRSGTCFGDPNEFASERQTILDLTTATIVLNLGGALLSATGLGMVLLDSLGSEQDAGSAATPRPRVGLTVSASPVHTHLGLTGRF